MNISEANEAATDTRPAVHSRRSCRRSLHRKPAWMKIALRKLTAVDTERIVRREWERYARRGQIAGSEPQQIAEPSDACRLVQQVEAFVG